MDIVLLKSVQTTTYFGGFASQTKHKVVNHFEAQEKKDLRLKSENAWNILDFCLEKKNMAVVGQVETTNLVGSWEDAVVW